MCPLRCPPTSLHKFSPSRILLRLLTGHLQDTLCHNSPPGLSHPTGRTLGCLSRMIKRPAMSAQYAARGNRSFVRHSANFMTICRSLPIASPKRRSKYCRLIKSVPHGPGLPDRHHATSTNVSSAKSKSTSSFTVCFFSPITIQSLIHDSYIANPTVVRLKNIHRYTLFISQHILFIQLKISF